MRRLDYGDKHPSDQGDQTPRDPTLGMEETDYSFHTQQSLKLPPMAGGVFDPNKVENPVPLRSKNVFYGWVKPGDDYDQAGYSFTDRKPTEEGDLNYIDVMTEDGIVLKAQVVPFSDDETFDDLDPVIVVRGSIGNTFYALLERNKSKQSYFELKYDLAPGGTATAYKLDNLSRIDTNPPNETWKEAEVKDILGTTRGKGADDEASPDPLRGTILLARRAGGEWHIVHAQPWPLRVRGKLTTDLKTTDETCNLVEVEVIAPIGAIDVRHVLDALDQLLAANTHKWAGDQGGIARAEWNAHRDSWELYQVDCPEEGY